MIGRKTLKDPPPPLFKAMKGIKKNIMGAVNVLICEN
jgi:hypothetical protein